MNKPKTSLEKGLAEIPNDRGDRFSRAINVALAYQKAKIIKIAKDSENRWDFLRKLKNVWGVDVKWKINKIIRIVMVCRIAGGV